MLFLTALGIQIVVFDIRSTSTNSSSPNSVSVADPNSLPTSNPTKAVTLSVFQVVLFTLVVGWSLVHVYWIHVELGRCLAAEIKRSITSSDVEERGQSVG
jgi:hypothetical protein